MPLSKLYKLKTGLYKEKLYEPPSKNPPVDDKAFKKLKEIKKNILQFKIDERLYDRDNLEAFFGEDEPPKKEKKDPKKVDTKDKKGKETKDDSTYAAS